VKQATGKKFRARATAGVGALAVAVAALAFGQQLARNRSEPATAPPAVAPEPEGAFVEVPALELATAPTTPADRNRERYRQALDALQKDDGAAALVNLDGLEADYPALGDYILLQRARALELTGDRDRAAALLGDLAATAAAPVAAEALYTLGDTDRLLAAFPHAPRALDLARDRLAADPNQPELLAQVAVYDPHARDAEAIRDRLVADYADRLGPAEWEAIATGYWDRWQYPEAGKAYANAPATPRNLYRAARGHHIAGDESAARTLYEQLVAQFPDAETTGFGRRRYALLLDPAAAIAQLDTVIADFPDEAAAALRQKADLLDQRGDRDGARALRMALLEQHSPSEAAADYRWEMVREHWRAGDLSAARDWADSLVVANPDSPRFAEAAYWAGKWSADDAAAAEYFQLVLRDAPESYFAWRSAVQLGWPVGDFETTRSQRPTLELPTTRLLPPAASPAVRELYRLGDYEAAWRHWRTERGARDGEPFNVSEQFTDGLLHVASGRYLRGMAQIGSLRARDEPAERQQWQALRAHPGYWHALFPLPYTDLIEPYAAARQLNPVLVTALMRQESAFEPAIASVAGARGLMQVMPATGEWVAAQIGLEDYALDRPADSINIGTWYLQHVHDQYGDNSMLAVASYNAGPGNVANWVRRFDPSDPDVFVADIPFPETQGYVESVFGNYWNYLRLYDPAVAARLDAIAAAPATDWSARAR